MEEKWVTDASGNKCSIAYWGSEESARRALDSLIDCHNCSDCSGCSGCSGCSDCSHVAYLVDKTGLRGDPEATAQPLGQPPIPRIENIHQRVYAAASAPGALRMADWHTCSNTHCRGGWVVHLAGEAGYALARFHNDALAAQLIYRESGAPINPGRFHDNNEDALADMKRLAEAEAAGE